MKPVRIDENANSSRFSWRTLDQPGAVEINNHLVHGWRGDFEVSLHIGFGRRASDDLCIDEYKG